jgi:hypothetical protein
MVLDKEECRSDNLKSHKSLIFIRPSGRTLKSPTLNKDKHIRSPSLEFIASLQFEVSLTLRFLKCHEKTGLTHDTDRLITAQNALYSYAHINNIS